MLHPIEIAAESLPKSIWNTAELYKEGRNVLIYCLCRRANRTELEVVRWLKENNKKVKDLDDYIIKDG